MEGSKVDLRRRTGSQETFDLSLKIGLTLTKSRAFTSVYEIHINFTSKRIDGIGQHCFTNKANSLLDVLGID